MYSELSQGLTFCTKRSTAVSRLKPRRPLAVGLLLAQLLGIAPALASEVLRVLSWPGYADPDIVVAFENEFDVDVQVSVVTSDDELWARVNANGGRDFDVFAVNTAELQRYIDKGLSAPIRVDNIPNHANQLPRFQDLTVIPGATREGKVYAVPYTYSEMGLIYDRNKVKEVPRSMAAMWDPDYRGQVLAFDTSNHNFSIVGLLLGAENPFHLSEGELSEAARRLVQLRRNVLTFYKSPEESVDLFMKSDVVLIFGNYGMQQVKQLREAGADIDYVIPQEGALAWLDCWSVTRSASNRGLAEAWINYTLRKSVSSALTQRQGLANTVEPPANTHDSSKIIWLKPIGNYSRRSELWERIRSGDVPESF